MPRTLFAAGLSTVALVLGTLAPAPAQAQTQWSNPGDWTNYRLCRASADGGDTWRFVSKVSKYAGTPDARAGIQVYSAGDRAARWSSGWLKKGEVQIGTVRVKKSKKVRVQVWEEAGDRDSSIGTALQITMLRPKKIRHC